MEDIAALAYITYEDCNFIFDNILTITDIIFIYDGGYNETIDIQYDEPTIGEVGTLFRINILLGNAKRVTTFLRGLIK